MTSLTWLIYITTAVLVLPHLCNRYRKNPVGIFAGFWHNTGALFRPPLLWLTLGSVMVTFLWTASGLDLELQKLVQTWIPERKPGLWVLFRIGDYWHVLPAIVLYAAGWLAKHKTMFAAGSASLQALLINVWLVLGLKLITGRRGPIRFFGGSSGGSFIRSADPWDYQFDFWNRVFADGRFFWPSGHTASIFAFVSALVALFPEKRWIAFAGYPLAAGMGFIMTIGNFHWSSDVLAGALIGHAAGWSAGKYMRRQLRETSALAAN